MSGLEVAAAVAAPLPRVGGVACARRAGGGFPRSRRCARAVPRPAPGPAFSVTCALLRVETSDRPHGPAS